MALAEGIGRGLPKARERLEPGAVARRLPWPVTIFVISLVVPWVIDVGGSRLSPSRIYLTFTVVPCLVMWASGKAGRIRVADLAVLGYCFWAVIAFSAVYDPGSGIRSGGLVFVETAGAYFLARCFIRTPDDFRNMVAVLFKIVVVLLPFALFEVLTGQKPILQLARLVLPSIDVTMMDIRWGLYRAQGPFEHPILFGVFSGCILALTHLVLGEGQPLAKRWLQTGLVAFTAFLSLSSGPVSAIAAQVVLLGWNWAFGWLQARWKLLWGLIAAAWIGISLASSQSVPAFYLTHAPMFDRFDGYYRLLEWQYGVATVMHHPLFGIGFEPYERPDWMAASIDMFWLTHGVDFGIPGAVLMMLTFVASVATVGLRSVADSRTQLYRTAYLISMASFFLCGWAVHFWSATYCAFIFLVASGLWIADSQPTKTAPLSRRASPRTATRQEPPGRKRPATARRPSAPAPALAKSRQPLSEV